MSRLSTMSDYELVGMYENGKDEAFDELLARHQQHLFAYILRLVPDENQANDVFQDTFIKAITRMRSHQYRNTGKFSAWLMRIAHNVVVDNSRSPRNMPHLSQEEHDRMIYNNDALSDESIEKSLLEESDQQLIAALISRLPKPQQEIIHLRYYEELSFKEIATITDTGINTCLGRMHYAIGNLRRLIAEYELDIAV